MGGVATEMLPRDAELARRAAGGDGAAFVRLYDSYCGVVFEAALAATGSVETAAEVTQTAFLHFLRRPPALDAPDSEVAERLPALAVAAAGEPLAPGAPVHGSAAGVGWLRSETVANAGARFDADWSVHLADRVEPVPEPEPEPVAPAPRRRRIFAFTWPTPAAPARAAAVLMVAVVSGALGLTAGSDGPNRLQRERVAERSLAPERDRPARESAVAGVRRTKAGRRRVVMVADAELTGAHPAPVETAFVPVSGGNPVARGGAPAARPQRSGSARTRGPLTGADGDRLVQRDGQRPASPSPAPAPSPSPRPAPPPESEPPPAESPPPEPEEPAPNPNHPSDSPDHPASGRNCNSKNSSAPC
ncbi:MAG TPA: hypothetical protein VD790_05600 [Thermoleophilaceae bacterium]|nr:hypothetical protein [Thermoleophilaceae bacterium]